MHFHRVLATFALIAAVAACGGGGSTSPTPQPTPTPTPVPVDLSCNGPGMANVVEGMALTSVNTFGIQPHNCQLSGTTEGAPVLPGKWAVKITLKPGECGGNAGFDDCKNDRSRFELSEVVQASTNGQKLVREFRLYIPLQQRLRPMGTNIMFLSQLNFGDESAFGTLAYLEVGSDGNLYVRTHKGLTWDVQAMYPAYQNPYGKWINVRYEVLSTTAANGTLKVYVDNRLVVDEIRQTLPSASGVNYLRVGIYNAFLSQAMEPYAEQVVYYDQIKNK